MSDPGHPTWRRVFRLIIELADATEQVNKMLPERRISPADDVDYTLGTFCRKFVCKRNARKVRELIAAFERGATGG